jgi:signal transduction histidine kinase
MKQSQRYVLLFTSFVCLSTLVLAGYSVFVIENAYSRFSSAPNKELAAALWRRMAFDAEVSLILGALVITAIAIPTGIGLWRMSSRRYHKILYQLESLAHERLGLAGQPNISETEEAVWEYFVPILIQDLAQLRDREKIEAWKEGARMLMHELKNPMTPLKLSAQQLSMEPGYDGMVVNRILDATESMERILGYFKNLVNVEFGSKEIFNWMEYCTRINQSYHSSNKSVTWFPVYHSQSIEVESERTLLRMVIDNLVNNGLEACPDGIQISVIEKEARVEIEILSPEICLSETERIFRPGYSTKGKARGYGLFLCKTISDYLELGIWFRQDPKGVIFGFHVPKSASSRVLK